MSEVSGDRVRKLRPALVAVDLGAESCRVSLLRWKDGQPEIQLVHRFPNAAKDDGSGLRWDIAAIVRGVEEGLRTCARLAPEGIAAIGVDGWAVDYVRLGADGQPVANPFCYRDERAVDGMQQVHSRISPDRLYELTGVQIISLNTLYQLRADDPKEQSIPWINVPEFLMYRLGGKRVSEYTNATHTQLLSVQDESWCPEIFKAAELDVNAAPPLVKPGTDIGGLRSDLASLPSLRETRLIAPACHDTASAIAGIPAEGNEWAFISSGTWSLVGCVLDSACVSHAARRANFSNEGGVGGKIYFLKNVNGMWLLRQCLEHWKSQGQIWTVEQLVEACATFDAPECVIDVDDPDLLLPGDMPGRINAQLSRIGQPSISEGPDMAAKMTSLILHSLAARYAAVLENATSITGKTLKRLYIVGGGSKNTVLNRLTEKATGLQVLTGSTESATVGNLAIQLAQLDGNYTHAVGVTADAVARWASVLSAQPVPTLDMEASGNTLAPTTVKEVQRPDWKGTGMTDKPEVAIHRALDNFNIELPSWGFANTGTRFGKFIQLAAAVTVEDKFSDAGQVHALTGACPTVALHVQWDMPNGLKDVAQVKRLAEKYGVQPGSINPNVFQDQEYKYGSVGNPDPAIRKRATDHILDCVAIADALDCRDISPWFADGSNYPGTQSIRHRIGWFEEALKAAHAGLNPKQRLLVEYKPFEPAFYHSDIADWGMAFLLARNAGPQAYVLVDTGHHYQAQNIEQIVAWLLHHGMIGGFHFNDRRYADDDLTLGSIDPYQIFRIFHEIHNYAWETGKAADVAYMVDQSHNLKGKMEAMIQTVCTAQELYAKAAIVDHARLAPLQQSCSLVEAEETLRGAFWFDVRPAIREWRNSHGLPEDPMQAFRDSGYLEKITAERKEHNAVSVTTYA